MEAVVGLSLSPRCLGVSASGEDWIRMGDTTGEGEYTAFGEHGEDVGGVRWSGPREDGESSG